MAIFRTDTTICLYILPGVVAEGPFYHSVNSDCRYYSPGAGEARGFSSDLINIGVKKSLGRQYMLYSQPKGHITRNYWTTSKFFSPYNRYILTML